MKIRHWLRFPMDIRRAKHKLGHKYCMDASFTGRSIALDLHTPDLMFDCGRHFAAFAHWTSENKSPLVLRCSRLLLAAIGRKPFGGQMLEMPNVAWVDTDAILPRNALVITDQTSDHTSRLMLGQQILHLQIGRDVVDGSAIAPYPMHPNVAPFAEDDVLAECRKTANRSGIFFAGSQRAKYGRAVIGRDFGVMNRLEILNTLRKSFRSRVVTEIKDYDKPKPTSGEQPIVLPDAGSTNITPDVWLETLAKHQFFLCCPGIAQPMCHNMTESMSVGTIPIIEYGDRVVPQLQDGVNAICFSGSDGLISAIDRIDQMSLEQIGSLSSAASEFYDNHLSGKRFMAKLCDPAASGDKTHLCLPFHSENLFEATVKTAHAQVA